MSEQSHQELKDTIEFIDGLSQSELSEIISISRMASAYLKTLSVNNEDIANALSVIRNKAECMMNCINAQAEEVGCNCNA